MQIILEDNNAKGRSLHQLLEQSVDYSRVVSDLKRIANKPIGRLDVSNLLIFPHDWNVSKDEIHNSIIIGLEETENDCLISSGNIMGFVGVNEAEVFIKSRFANDDGHDYFLHYMLQKVNKLNIVNFDLRGGKDTIWDFLIYMFPDYLSKAIKQGLYKEYRHIKHNDTNVKGSIDVSRHIRTNIPFAGKIAYNTREYSFDNPVLQLVRHTIEYIKTHPYGRNVLARDSEMIENVSKIVFYTPTYNKNDRQKIVNANRRLVRHPYFTEYKNLQIFCLRVLRHEKLSFSGKKDKIHGILFDGAWLWEEYLNTVLKKDFIHPENKTGKNGFKLFEKGPQRIYPDFISEQVPKIVADAKYIPLNRQESYAESDDRLINIYYKTITYMYRFNSKRGLLFFPYPFEGEPFNKEYKIEDREGTLTKIGFNIPKNIDDWGEFQEAMKKSECKFKNTIKKISE
ncbi:McrC family protein [Treponema sp. TIM-1]|uniref:McrC family protein n=1 Tax=Treponema sp. TIM-1 TaxID=2898417 RepID=UPI0039814A20